MWQRSLDHRDSAEHIGVENRVAEGGIARLERPIFRYAGAIHDHVDMTEPRNNLPDHRLGRFGIRDVPVDGNALRSRLGDIGEHGLRGRARAATADRNLAADGRKAPSNGGTDAARASGHQHDFTTQRMPARRILIVGTHAVFSNSE